MILEYDGDYDYRGYHGCKSRCHLRIFQTEPHECKPYIVIATELDNNPGTSITNMAEYLAWEVWKFLERPIQGMAWYEHYRDRAIIGRKPQFTESFDIVTFEKGPDGRFSHPAWRLANKDEIRRLVGCLL